jgi:hypothetical protein
MGMMDEHKPDSGLFRFIIGLTVMATAIGGFAALFFIKVPVENKDAMMFALGAVFQWAAGVVASEYGASTTGRKVAESAVRQIERQTVANESPQEVTVTNTTADPVPVTGAKP